MLNSSSMPYGELKYTVVREHISDVIFVRPCIIDTNNIDNQLEATIMVY